MSIRREQRIYITNFNRKRDLYKDTSKEERAKELNNIICPRCKYQNHLFYVKKYGTCHLCGVTLDNNYFKIVNQYSIEDKSTRRPDLLVFINGIPIAIFEFF